MSGDSKNPQVLQKPHQPSRFDNILDADPGCFTKALAPTVYCDDHSDCRRWVEENCNPYELERTVAKCNIITNICSFDSMI